MKKFILLSAAALAFAGVAQADCASKISKLQIKLKEAKRAGNFYQVQGLERAIAKTRANCYGTGLSGRDALGRYDRWMDEDAPRVSDYEARKNAAAAPSPWAHNEAGNYRALKRELDALEDHYDALEDEIEDALDDLKSDRRLMSASDYAARRSELKAQKRALKAEYKAKKRAIKERYYR